MSDAMGDKNDPTTGDTIEPAEAGAEETPVEAAAADVAAGPAADGATGAVDEGDAATTVDAPEAAVGPGQGRTAEPSADTAIYELDDDVAPSDDEAEAHAARDEKAEAPADEGPDADGAVLADASEPTAEADETHERGGAPVDYAALAAELEEFEARQAGAAGAAPAAHTAPTVVGDGWFEQDEDTFKATEPEEEPEPDDALTEAVGSVDGDVTMILPSEPASNEAPAAASPGVILETYEPPRKRGNRVAALLIGVPATVAFTILYGIVDLLWGWYQDEVSLDSLVADVLARIAEPAYWTPVIVFFLAFWLIGVIVNRGRAGWWVVLGFVVALLTYAGFVLAPVIAYPFWMMTPNDASDAMEQLVLNPVAIATFVIAREVTVWFGAWVAGRGRRMKRLNAEDKAEYDRAVAAGD